MVHRKGLHHTVPVTLCPLFAKKKSPEGDLEYFLENFSFLYSNVEHLLHEIDESFVFFLLLLLLFLFNNTLVWLWRFYSYLYPNGVCIGGNYE